MRKRQTFRPALEALEDRTVPSSWIGYLNHGSTNWNDTTNWDDHKIPFKPGSGSNTALFATSSRPSPARTTPGVS